MGVPARAPEFASPQRKEAGARLGAGGGGRGVPIPEGTLPLNNLASSSVKELKSIKSHIFISLINAI